MAAYRRVYDSRHLQADCQEPGSAPEPYALQSSTGYFFMFRIELTYQRILERKQTPERGNSACVQCIAELSGKSSDICECLYPVPDYGGCYWCCSIRPNQELGPRGHGRENEQSLLYILFVISLVGTISGKLLKLLPPDVILKLKCTIFDFG